MISDNCFSIYSMVVNVNQWMHNVTVRNSTCTWFGLHEILYQLQNTLGGAAYNVSA